MGISAEFSDDLAIRLGLTKLPEYFPVFLLSFLAFTAIHLLLAPFLSLWLVPELYGNMSKRARNNWCVLAVRHLLLTEVERGIFISIISSGAFMSYPRFMPSLLSRFRSGVSSTRRNCSVTRHLRGIISQASCRLLLVAISFGTRWMLLWTMLTSALWFMVFIQCWLHPRKYFLIPCLPGLTCFAIYLLSFVSCIVTRCVNFLLRPSCRSLSWHTSRPDVWFGKRKFSIMVA